MVDTIDPICGMTVDVDVAKKKGLVATKDGKTAYFCNVACKQKWLSQTPWYRSETFGRLFPFVLAGILIGGTIVSILFDFMLFYMGIFFVVFSLFKMPDWKGFVEAFSTYDLLAMRSKAYARIYPALEFLLGVLYLLAFYWLDGIVLVLAGFTAFLMLIGGIGVGIKLAKREKFQCACLGTIINVPLTKVTLLENGLMFVMALMLLL